MKYLLITICFLLAQAVCVYGSDLLVPSQYPTIRAAVDAAVDGDTVIIAPGTYSGMNNQNITVNKLITIRSQDGPQTCIIDSSYDTNSPRKSGTIFSLTSGTLAGLTITGAYYNSAVVCPGGTSKLSNCILTNNNGFMGAALSCGNSNVEITNCKITENSTLLGNSGHGGGIYCQNSSLSIYNSIISKNIASNGGGICCISSSNVTIKNCQIEENISLLPQLAGGGGGIYCDSSYMTIINTDMSNNIAVHGGAISFNNAYTALISNCNISENKAVDANNFSYEPTGGGIYYKSVVSPSRNGATFYILSSSIINNEVNGLNNSKGGAIYFETSPSNIQNIKLLIDRCKINHNKAANILPGQGNSYGGAIYCNGRMNLFETQIVENSSYNGGGICSGPETLPSSSITLNRCILKANKSASGNAVLSYAGENIFENCLVSGNRDSRNRSGNSPAILCYTSFKMTNCTVVGNTYSAIGWSSQLSKSSISNSIFCSNPGLYDQIPSGIPVTYSDVQMGPKGIYPGLGNINADPCFVLPGYWDTNGTTNPQDDFWVEGDYRLGTGSPCIDTGGFAFLMDDKDLADNPRINGAAIDMGAYENNNMPPIANAGPDQTVYAWINGKAQVQLDGSSSYDGDGDSLSYLWQWSIDGNNTSESNKVDPTIELPIGQYTIEFTVNDGFEDSQPDDVNISVIGPVQGRLWLFPASINRQSFGLNILTMIKFSDVITKDQFDMNFKLRLYPGNIEAKYQNTFQYWDNGTLKTAVSATFDRRSLTAAVKTNGNITLDVVGKLVSGQYFFGETSVRIFDNMNK